MKKAFAWLLCVTMVLAACPLVSFAAPAFKQEAYFLNFYTDASMTEKNIIDLSIGGSGVTYTSDQPAVLKPIDATSGKFEVLKENFNGNAYTPKPVIVTATQNGASATTNVYTTASSYTTEKALYVFDRMGLDLKENGWTVLSGTSVLPLTLFAKTKTSFCYRYGGEEAPYLSLDTNTVAVTKGGKTILRFTAPRDGDVILPATKLGTPSGGAQFSISYNGKVIFPVSGKPEAVGTYEEIPLTLKKGDKVDFTVQGGGEGVATQSVKPTVRYIKRRLPENPLGLTIDKKMASTHILAEGRTSETDTLQLALNAGQVEVTLQNAAAGDNGAWLANAVDYRDSGNLNEYVELEKKNGKVVVTLNDSYKGGRDLSDLQIIMHSKNTDGSLYNVDCFYTTRANNTKEIHFASFYNDEAVGRVISVFPLLSVKNAETKVKDVHQLIFYVNAEEADSKLGLVEIDANFKNESADIQAARTKRIETVRFSTLYTDNALIQRDKAFEIWGYGGKANVKVELLNDGTVISSATSAVKDGTWKVNLPAVEGSHTPYALRATDVDNAENKAESQNILFGDVWLLGGQSNMGVAVVEDIRAREILDQGGFDGIRYFKQKEIGTRTPVEDPVDGKWKPATGQTLRELSAVGYLFARKLYQDLDKRVPIGLVYSATGSTAAEAWIPLDMIKNDPDYASLNNFDDPIDVAVGGYHERRASAPYNGMLLPVSGLNVTGALWYQGNSNARNKPEVYSELMSDLIDHWRKLFDHPTMPFFFVQLEGVNDIRHPFLRQEQFDTMMEKENTGMVTAVDVGDRNNAHSPYKLEIGERLAAMALSKTYGGGGEYAGPIWKSIQKDGNDVVVTFTHTTGGLKLKEGTTITHVETSTDGTNYTPATAVIDGDTMRIQNVAAATHIRYAYIGFPDPALNLYNGAGFPAFPIVAQVGATNKAEPAYTDPVKTLPGVATPSVSFTDVENHWGKPYILPLAEAGIIKGKSANSFDPDGQITRAEFLTLALKVAGITASGTGSYPDVGADTWFAATVATAKEKGLIDVNMTTDGNFYPDRNITREEMTSVIVKLYESQKGVTTAGDVLGFSDNATFSAWAKDSIGKAVGLGVVTGNPDGTFNARGNATRAEAAVIFSRLRAKL